MGFRITVSWLLYCSSQCCINGVDSLSEGTIQLYGPCLLRLHNRLTAYILFHPYKFWICSKIWHPSNLKRNHTKIFKCSTQQNQSVNNAQEVGDMRQKDEECHMGNNCKNPCESAEPPRQFCGSCLTRCSHQYKTTDRSQVWV